MSSRMKARMSRTSNMGSKIFGKNAMRKSLANNVNFLFFLGQLVKCCHRSPDLHNVIRKVPKCNQEASATLYNMPCVKTLR